MNRIRKILEALRIINRSPASAIADAWAMVFAEASKCREGDRAMSDALDLIGSVVRAVVGVAEDADKKGEA